METIYLGLGSNRGHEGLDPSGIILRAAGELEKELADIRLSRLWMTRARYVTDQPDFCNAVLEARTSLSPRELLRVVNSVEAFFGRNRETEKNKGPRSLDIDILLYGNRIVVESDLVIPHPGIRERKFVLAPLVSLSPRLSDPVSGKSFIDFFRRLPLQGVYLAQSGRDTLFYP